MRKHNAGWLGIVVVAVAVLVFVLAGCSSADATTAQIISQSQEAGAALQSYQFNVSLTAGLSASGGSTDNQINLQITGDGNGALDKVNKSAHMLLNLNADIPLMGTQKSALEYYLLGGWIYAKVSGPEENDRWVKAQYPEAGWPLQDQIAQHLDLLKNALQVDQAGTDNIDGVACYILDVKPDLNKLTGLLSGLEKSLAPEAEQYGLPSPTPEAFDLSRFVKQIGIKEWVAKDSYRIVKVAVTFNVSLPAADLLDKLPTKNGGTNSAPPPSMPLSLIDANSQLTLNLSLSVNYFGFNLPVNINLPADAQDAQN